MQSQIASEILAFSALFICGQGFGVLLMLLSPRNKKSTAQYLLAAFIAVNCYSFFTEYFRYSGMVLPKYVFWISFVYILEGALFYLYVKSLVSLSFRFKIQHALHLLPALVILIPQFSPNLLPQNLTTTYFGYLIYYSLLIAYGIAALRLLPDYGRFIRNHFSSVNRIELDWLYKLIIVLIASSVVFLVLRVLEFRALINTSDFHQLYIPNTIIYCICFYFISVGGYFQKSAPKEELIEIVEAGHQTLQSQDPPLAEDNSDEEVLNLVQDYMKKEEPFLNSELSLRQLAHGVELSPHQLSQVLNATGGQSFYDFVNGYRAEKAQQLIRTNIRPDLSMIDIGMEAGFGNKMTFYKYFKKRFSQTPRQYRTQIEAKGL